MRSKSVSVSDRRAGEKSGVSGNTGIVPEMDDAVEGLAISRFIIGFSDRLDGYF